MFLFPEFAVTSNNKVKYHLTNPHLTLIRDTTYIEGEYALYSVSLNSEWAFNSTEFSVPIKDPRISLSLENKMLVCWNKTTNPQRLGYYHVSYKIPDNQVIQEFSRNNPDDTLAVVNLQP